MMMKRLLGSSGYRPRGVDVGAGANLVFREIDRDSGFTMPAFRERFRHNKNLAAQKPISGLHYNVTNLLCAVIEIQIVDVTD